MTKTIHEILADIQRQLHAPKNKNNNFGGYKYRNAEGILAAFKALEFSGASLTCSDSVQEVAGQIFVTATATLTIGGESVSATGHAMHPLQKKGMDASQITGSASSYARKYALGGLLAIEDESQDPDSRDNGRENGQTPPPVKKITAEEAEVLKDLEERAHSDRAAVFNAMRLDGDAWGDLPAEHFEFVHKGLLTKLDQMEQDAGQATKSELNGDEIPY